MIYDLNESTLTNLIDFFQKQQMDMMKQVTQISDAKEGKRLQKQIGIFNTLVMNLLKLKELRKPTA